MNSYKPHTLHHLYNQEEIRPDFCYYWYYDEDDDIPSYWEETPWGVHYEYCEDDLQQQLDLVYHQRMAWRHRCLTRTVRIDNLKIDMMSVYSKEMLRQIKIDKILDREDRSNTIGNLIQLKQL